METISPQVIWLVADTASKILSRVLSARAFDIFSTSERFMLDLECSEVVGLAAINRALREGFHKTCIRLLRWSSKCLNLTGKESGKRLAPRSGRHSTETGEDM